MPNSSGFSIQRNEIIDIPHRSQYEVHVSNGNSVIYPLRSKIDYIDKNWEWEIKVGEVRYTIDRKIGNNSLSGAGTDISLFEETKTYSEGSTTAGEGSVVFDSSAGEFGSLIFATEYAPQSGDRIEIRYLEHENQWTGTDGGLLYQLAKDLTIHPFDTPELFKVRQDQPTLATDITAVETLQTATALNHTLTVKYNEDYVETGVEGNQRVASKLWKIVKEHRVASIQNLSTGTNLGTIPFTPYDLGDGEFRVSINGRMLEKADFLYVGTETATTRETAFTLVKPSAELTWVPDLTQAEVSIGFHWKHSIAVPFGAEVGFQGLGPMNEAKSAPGTRYDFLSGNNNAYTTPTEASPNGQLQLGWDSAAQDFSVNLDASSHNNNLPQDGIDPQYVDVGDMMMLEFENDSRFEPPFKLIYPTPLSSVNKNDIKMALRSITDSVLLESSKGVDLLSDETLTPEYSSPTSNRRPQKWRIRLNWDKKQQSLKVHVATEYQLLDDFTVTNGQDRDGIKSPIYREPGELCDVYQEPNIGRGNTYKIIKSKSDFFRRHAKTQDDVSRTYPLSDRVTTTDHGMGLFIWDQASVDQDDDYAWFVVQRHVDQTTGQPEFGGKSPVHCVYSPVKKPVEIANLTPYFSTVETNDLTKTQNVFTSFGQVLETEGPTIYIDQSEKIFNGWVNAIDFTGRGYFEGLDGTGGYTNQKTDLDVGIIGSLGSDTEDYWYRVTDWTGDGSATASGGGDAFPGAFSESVTKPVVDLNVTGFVQLPRSGKTTIANTTSWTRNPDGTAATPEPAFADYPQLGFTLAADHVADWIQDARLAPSFSGNVIYPQHYLDRVSAFEAAAATTNSLAVDKSDTSITDWKDPSFAALDILYNENAENQQKVLDSLIISVDGTEIIRDTEGFVMNYDDWVRNGDPSTVLRFLESLDAAGVNKFGSKFRLPVAATSSLPTALTDLFNSIVWKDPADGTTIIPAPTSEIDWNSKIENLDPTDPLGGSYIDIGQVNTITGEPFQATFVINLLSLFVDHTDLLGSANSNQYLVASSFVAGAVRSNKLPGDVVFSDTNNNRNRYIWDFFNQTLHFRNPPRAGANLVVKLLNYTFADPANNAYYVTEVKDRNFPETNMNNVKTINRFIVREQDVLKPWDYHVSATMHEIDSNAIINPQEQLSITQDRDFVFSFPTQITSQRFYYPRSELDLICISSADFSTQSGHIEIDKYSDSNGNPNELFSIDGTEFNPTSQPEPAPGATGTLTYAGHLGPDGQKYYWKRYKRKYEGMMSTEPNGNGMRVFLQTTGSSIKYSDTVEGSMN